MDMAYNQMGMGNGYGYYGGYPNPMMGGMYGNGIIYNNGPVPTPASSLSEEEIKILKSSIPSKFDLSITPEEDIKSKCNHRDLNGRDVVQQVNDGSGDVFCHICNERWNPEPMNEEDVKAMIDNLIAQFQNLKWLGEMPIPVVREYCAMMPLLRKFPQLYKYAMNNFNKYFNTNQYYNAQDASIYGMYNSLINPAFGAMSAQYMGGYYGQQPMQMQGAPQYQQPMMNGQMANPNINPMQMQGAPQYQQPIMGNGYYGQQPMQMPQYQQPMGMQPTFAGQQMMAQQQPQPYVPNFQVAQQPQQQAQAQQQAADAGKPSEQKVNL